MTDAEWGGYSTRLFLFPGFFPVIFFSLRCFLSVCGLKRGRARTLVFNINDPSILTYLIICDCRPDLVSYIRRWPSEECEQSAWKADAAAHNLTLQISNVSCDVKCARALVKTAEMRSSLLAQKLLFLADHQRQLEASFTLPSLPSMSTF